MKSRVKSCFVVVLACAFLSACAAPEHHAGPKRAMEITDFYRCATVSAPALSPDGRLVAFGVKRNDLEAGKSWSELWCMRPDGSDLRQLTRDNSDTDPAFSPDGKRLLFASSRDGGGQLWTLDLDGGSPHKLTAWAPGLGTAKWSPDGRWIAATSDVFPDVALDAAAQKARADELTKGGVDVHVADDLYYPPLDVLVRRAARPHPAPRRAQREDLQGPHARRLREPDLLAGRPQLRLLARRPRVLLRQQP